MNVLAVLPLLLAPAQADSEEAVYRVPIRDLVVTGGELPSHTGAVSWDLWQRIPAMMPRAVLLRSGEVYYDHPEWNEQGWWNTDRFDPADGFLVVRTPHARNVQGWLYFPTTSWEGQVSVSFEIPAGAAGADADDFHRAKMRHYRRLLLRRIPGTAWFRHRHNEAAAEVGAALEGTDALGRWQRTNPDHDLQESYGLFSGGRALSENLQLDRLIPNGEGEGEMMPLADVEGITVREFDWSGLLEGVDPELDPLARLVPADQHAVFFPSFQAMVELLDQAEELGEPVLTLFEERSQDAGSRARYERQLCLELDAVTRALGPAAIRSVAFTGSDPYLRTGSDVALLFEAPSPAGADAVYAFVRARQEAVAAEVGIEPSLVEIGDWRFHGFATPARDVSTYAGVFGDTVIVSNSLYQLACVLAAATDGAPNLSAVPEYRFFRDRYQLGTNDESAFVMVPDAAIRRWCGPRWRIATSRRTRAAAVLADLQAEYLDPIVAREDQEVLPSDARFPGLGDLTRTPAGVASSVYGRFDFQTPIAELELDQVSKREAELYGRWRDGYQSNWSNYFDPIAIQLSASDERIAFDMTVMPLIVGTEYREFRGLVGDAKLGPESGDPHADSFVHFALALDRESEMMREIDRSLSGMMAQFGASALDWMGGSIAVYIDRDPVLEDLLASEDREDALENLWVDVNEIPLVIHFEVESGLRLATFLATMRAFMDGTAPGMLQWHSETSGEHRFVRLSSDGLGRDASIYYATTPSSFFISLNEGALVRALEREAARGAAEEGEAAESPWLGESMALELDRDGLALFQLIMSGDLGTELRNRSWDNLSILNEWKQRFPELDPVELHQQVWGETLLCPGGGEYVWNDTAQTMESTVFGHPGEPGEGVELPPIFAELTRLRFGLTFEHDGLRSRVELLRGATSEER